jgi:hypothetical protein
MLSCAALLLAVLPVGAGDGAAALRVAVVAGPDRVTLAEPLGPWVAAVRDAVRESPKLRLVAKPADAEAVVRIEDRYNPGDACVLAGSVALGGSDEPFRVHFRPDVAREAVARKVVSAVQRILDRQRARAAAAR